MNIAKLAEVANFIAATVEQCMNFMREMKEFELKKWTSMNLNDVEVPTYLYSISIF